MSVPLHYPALQNIYYKQQLQGQEVIDLFSQLEGCKSEQLVQKSLDNLLEFCKQVLASKQSLKDVSSRKSISKALSLIKSASTQLFDCTNTNQLDDEIADHHSKLAEDIISSVAKINNVFFTNTRCKQSAETNTTMQDLLSVLNKPDDMLHSDFDITTYSMNENYDDCISTCKSSPFIALQGRQTSKSKSQMSTLLAMNRTPMLEQCKSTTVCSKPSSRSVCSSEYLRFLDNSSELIESAHKILLTAQKVTPVQDNTERTMLKALRKNLNEAVIFFDVSTTNLVKNMENLHFKHEMMRNGANLLDAMKNMRRYIKDLKHRRRAVKNTEQTLISTQSGSDSQKSSLPPSSTSTVTSYEALLAMHSPPSSTHIPTCFSQPIPRAATANHSQASTLQLTEHPMNSLCLEKTIQILSDTAKKKDSEQFEKQVNDIADFQQAMKTFAIDITKRRFRDNPIIFEALLETSTRTSRNLLASARDVYEETGTNRKTKDALAQLAAVSNAWCTQQALFIDTVWSELSPWTKLFGKMFSLKQEEDRTGRINNSLFNDSMILFKEVNQGISVLSVQFEDTELNVAEEELFHGKASAHIQVHNLMLELKEYSTKLLQLGKLYLLGDIRPHEWLTFGLWLLRWANCVQHALCLMDRSLPVHHGHALSMKNIVSSHENWVTLSQQLSESCSQDSLHSLDTIMSSERRAYDTLMEAFDRTHENWDIKHSRLIFLLETWKLKLQDLSRIIEALTKYLSKPIDTLVISAMLPRHDHTNYHRLSFESYHVVFVKKMGRIRQHTCLAVEKATCRKDVHAIIEILDSFDETTEKMLRLCSQVEGSGSESVESLQSSLHVLKLAWLSNAHYLLYLLRKLPDVRFSAISALMRHLQTDTDMRNPYEFVDVITKEELPDSQASLLYWLEGGRATNSSGVEFDSMYSTWAGETGQSQVTVVGDADGCGRTFNPTCGFEDDGIAAVDQLLEDVLKYEQETDVNNHLQTPYRPLVSPKPPNYKRTSSLQKDRFHKDKSMIASKSGRTSVRKVRSESLSKSIAAAARLLKEEADQWEDTNNTIIKVVKLMANQMFQMAEYSKGRGSLKSKNDLVYTAKAIAANSKTVAKFAKTVAEECDDESCRADLQHYAELVPTISTQLRIVASVKSVNSNDETTDTMLVTNAANLMKGVVGTLKAAEAASVNMSTSSSLDENHDVRQSVGLAFQWKRKVRLKRAVDAVCSPRDENGLRLSKEMSLPSLTELVLKEDPSLYDLVSKRNTLD